MMKTGQVMLRDTHERAPSDPRGAIAAGAQNAHLLLRPDRRLGPLSASQFNALQIGADGR